MQYYLGNIISPYFIDFNMYIHTATFLIADYYNHENANSSHEIVVIIHGL